MSADATEAPPRHIAIIMDGNGRWARERGLPRIEGHREGAKTVAACVEACGEAGVKYLTLYAFSAENWKRPKHEIDALMKLLEQFLKEKTADMIKQRIRFDAIGRLSDLPEGCQRQIREAREATGQFEDGVLILALSYGSRREIVGAARQIGREVQDGKLNPAEIDEETISRRLYTAKYPDPDLLVRTSGEMRLSNFMLWQCSYAEFYVTPKLWPDFGKEDLHAAIAEFKRRHRRFGGL